jgi:hypothetical protein
MARAPNLSTGLPLQEGDLFLLPTILLGVSARAD